MNKRIRPSATTGDSEGNFVKRSWMDHRKYLKRQITTDLGYEELDEKMDRKGCFSWLWVLFYFVYLDDFLLRRGKADLDSQFEAIINVCNNCLLICTLSLGISLASMYLLHDIEWEENENLMIPIIWIKYLFALGNLGGMLSHVISIIYTIAYMIILTSFEKEMLHFYLQKVQNWYIKPLKMIIYGSLYGLACQMFSNAIYIWKIFGMYVILGCIPIGVLPLMLTFKYFLCSVKILYEVPNLYADSKQNLYSQLSAVKPENVCEYLDFIHKEAQINIGDELGKIKKRIQQQDVDGYCFYSLIRDKEKCIEFLSDEKYNTPGENMNLTYGKAANVSYFLVAHKEEFFKEYCNYVESCDKERAKVAYQQIQETGDVILAGDEKKLHNSLVESLMKNIDNPTITKSSVTLYELFGAVYGSTKDGSKSSRKRSEKALYNLFKKCNGITSRINKIKHSEIKAISQYDQSELIRFLGDVALRRVFSKS
jgi:hypothetical protein